MYCQRLLKIFEAADIIYIRTYWQMSPISVSSQYNCCIHLRNVIKADVVVGEIHVTKTVQRIWLSDGDEKMYALSVDQPKTASSVRNIPICKDLMKIVRPLRKVMADDFYIISNAAIPLEPRYYRDYFQKLLVQLGIPPTRFHALRHSFATRMHREPVRL